MHRSVFVLAAFFAFAVPCANAEVVVLWGNCRDALADRGCVANEDRTLTVWVRARAGRRIALRDQRRALEALETTVVDGGTRYEINFDARSTRLDVVDAEDSGSVLWSLPLTREPDAPDLDRVRALFGARDYDACEALLNKLTSDAAFDRRGSAERLAGIFYYSRGQPETARSFYRRAIATLAREGRALEAVRAASALAYLEQHSLRDFASARTTLAGMPLGPNASAEAQFFAAYDGGLLALNTGHPRDALRRFDDAARIARRMGDAGRWLQRQLDAEELLAAQLQRVGRRDDARAVFDAWSSRDLSSLSACERAQFGSNRAWSTLLTLEAGGTGAAPLDALDALVPAMRTHCPARELATLHIHRALAFWHDGRLDDATRALEQAQAATDRPELRLRFWELDIAARVAAARGRTDVALATLDALARLARATLSPDARWRAAARRGEVLEQVGRVDDALTAYAAADAELATDIAHVPLSLGHGPFQATRDWVTRRRIALLLDRDDSTAVAELVRSAIRRTTLATAYAARRNADGTFARLSRMRAAISEDLGAGWRVPADELAVLEAQRTEREQSLARALEDALSPAEIAADGANARPGEAQLAVYPRLGGWVLVTWTSRAVETTAFDCQDDRPNDVAQCALDAAGAALGAADRWVILPGSVLSQADVAGLAFNGAPVVATRRVTYGDGATRDHDWRRPAGAIAVMGDPTRQVPRARDEAVWVAQSLSREPRTVTPLLGKRATFSAARQQLDRAALWHFAGHADTAHNDTWRQALALAGGERLSVSDVLALPRVPDVVVLSACQTSGAGDAGQSGSVGLADAFLVAGARGVLATARAVDDEDALTFIRAFYANWHADTPADLALARTQRQLARSEQDIDWEAFRWLAR